MFEYGDILERNEIIQKLITIVEGCSNKRLPATFSIEGSWGIGKTFLLKLLEDELKMFQNEENTLNKYMIFHYNCWEYDYYEEPLVAIIASMIYEVEKEESLFSDNIQGYINAGWKEAKNILNSVFGECIKNKIGIDLINIKEDVKNIKDNTSKGKNEFDHYASFKKAIEYTRSKLLELSKDRTIVIVVDELDRCLPSYAIKVLERLHHVFYDIENVIVIMAIASNQLEQSIKLIYGNNTKVEDYLRKFIDFSIVIDSGKISNTFSEKYSEYISQFDFISEHDRYIFNDLFQKNFSRVDIRTQEKLLSKAYLIHNLVCTDEKSDGSLLGVEMIWILYAHVCEGNDLSWIPGINTFVNYTNIEKIIGKNTYDYFRNIEKKVGNMEVIEDDNVSYTFVHNEYYDKFFWLFASIYHEIEHNHCHTYMHESDKYLEKEVGTIRKFIQIAKITK